MTQTIKAIDTVYAGHRFRSRLEARWAVFFDTLGVRWEYEPQGYEVGCYETRRYLPDFLLPDSGLWVEVKGSDEAMDWTLMGDAVDGFGNHLPMSPEYRKKWGVYGGHGDEGAAVLILGSVPRHSGCDFVLVRNRKGASFDSFPLGIVFEAALKSGLRVRGHDRNIALYDATCGWVGGNESHLTVNGYQSTRLGEWAARHSGFDYERALTAARMARFEHGARGR
jgi:hypothetical protein